MKFRPVLAASTALAVLCPGVAFGQASGAATSDASAAIQPGDIVVTARQRQESLKDVPIAVTAVSGDTIKEQQITLIKDIANIAPGVNINSDSAGRAFISMRGIGTTIIDTVQPGVGLFIDGVYQPNTSYLNSPLVDVERVEVLRGPQGTLFGNNTLGGAISVITRQPSNTFEGRVDGALASGDNYGSVSGSISGPIVKDVLQFRIGAAYHTPDGFGRNTLANGRINPLETKSVNGTLRIVPTDWAVLTLKGSYDHVFGGSVPYMTVTGPSDFHLDTATNLLSVVAIDYYAVTGKGEFDVRSLNTKITAIGSYNQSDAYSTGDGDFTAVDFLRGTNNRFLKTTSGELRFDTKWSDHVSTLLGAFYSNATNDQYITNTIVPLDLTVPAVGHADNKNYAIFGTAFIKLGETLDLAAGLRFDHQKLTAFNSSQGGDFAIYEANQVQPRVTLTKHWTPDFMTYASVARGTRGGGQNEPSAPNALYRGDSVWTYEVGAKASAFNRRLSFSIDGFYNDYNDFIGPNALAPSTGGAGYVSVNLNAGHVESYGMEGEFDARLTNWWRLYGNITLLHARVTDGTEWFQTTGYAYPGDRIPFVPDVNGMIGTTIKAPVVEDQSIVFDASVIYKGSRAGESLDAASVPMMPSFTLVNASIGWQTPHFEVALFATNLFDEKYQETYLDSSLLGRAGVPAFLVNNLAIQGNRRRVGLRGSIKF